jgi:O-antigen ligase
MFQDDISLFYILFSVMLLILISVNLYWGTFIILLLQPLFITTFSEGAGYSLTKIIYGLSFATWFVVWALTRATARSEFRPLLSYPVAAPSIALGALLVIAIPVGFLYDASIDNIIRDLSQYVGYLAVLPLLDLAQTPHKAKRLLLCLALLGLPSSILTDVGWIGLKQGLELSPEMMVFQYAAPYWGPVQGALWVVALSFPGFAWKMMAWGLLSLRAALSLFSGFRHMLLTFLLSGVTAFFVTKRIARHNPARHLALCFLALAAGAVLADLSGLVTLPLSDRTRERYSTLLSEDNLLEDRSVQGRLIESQALFEAFQRNPFTGIGLGHSLTFVDVDRKMDRFQVRFRYHNGYLETLMKFGLLGAAVFAWFFLAILRQAFKVVRTGNTFFAKAFGLGLVIYLVSALAASVAGSFFSDRGFALTVGVMGGVLPALEYVRARAPQPLQAFFRNGKLRHYV